MNRNSKRILACMLAVITLLSSVPMASFAGLDWQSFAVRSLVADEETTAAVCENHTYTQDQLVTAPTCTKPGTQKEVCTVCGYVNTKTVPPSDHSDQDSDGLCDVCGDCCHATFITTEKKEASCTEAGYTGDKQCTVCGAILESGSEIAALGHSFTKYVSDGNATCAVDGTKTAMCDRCNVINTVTDADSHLSVPHTFTDYISDGNSTCTADGTRTATCDVCGKATDMVTEADTAIGHDWGDWTVVTPATCTKSGTEKRVCKNDASHVETRMLSVRPHTDADDDNFCDVCDSYMSTLRDSGTTGDLTWSFYRDDVLVFSGNGAMGTYFFGLTPWRSYSSQIKKVILKPGATKISTSSFNKCTNLEEIQIPDSVTTIGDSAFYGCTSIRKITLGSGVSSVTAAAFPKTEGAVFSDIYVSENNSNFTSVDGVLFSKDMTKLVCYPYAKDAQSYTVVNTVTSIEARSFSNNTSLKSILFEPECQVSQIGSSSFSGCTGLEEFNVPDSVTTIGSSAFNNCTSLAKLTFSENSALTSVGNYVFQNCMGLTVITLPQGVTAIGNYAFYGCTGLTEFTVPDSVSSIGNNAFSKCSSLSKINVSDNNESYSSEQGVLFNKDKTEIIKYPVAKTGTQYQIPSSVITVASYAFQDCAQLTEIEIPSGAKTINVNALNGCTGLESISLPFAGVSAESTDYQAMFGIIFGYTTISANGTVLQFTKKYSSSSTENYYYYIPSGLKKVTLTGNTAVYPGAFYNCSGLTDVTVGKNVPSIGNGTFKNCTGLESVTLPFIGKAADASGAEAVFGSIFGYITSSSSSVSGLTYQYYANSTYYHYYVPSGLANVSLDGAQTIPLNAFKNCTMLRSITLSDSVTTFDSNAFYSCSALESVHFNGTTQQWCALGFAGEYSNPLRYTGSFYIGSQLISGKLSIPNDTKTIGKYAFYYYSGIDEIDIADSVESIGDYAFYGCNNVAAINIGNGLSSVTLNAFPKSGSSALEQFTVTEDNNSFCAVDGVLYNKDKTVLICYPCAKKDTRYSVEDTVASIGEGAFESSVNLSYVDLPQSLTEIGRKAFYRSGIAEIVLPESITRLNLETFSYCKNLTDITIPASIVQCDGSFGFNTNLKNVYYNGSVSDWCSISFTNNIPLFSFRIANPLYYAKNLIINGEIITDLIVPQGVTEIKRYAFYGYKALKSVTVPSSVTAIRVSAFYGCSSLASVAFSENSSLATIENSAFNNCRALERVELAECIDLTTLGGYSFGYCSALAYISIPASITTIDTNTFYNYSPSLTIACYEDSAAYTFASSKNINIELLNHTYIAEHFDPTDDEEGYTLYTCTHCGYTYTVLDPAVKVEGFAAYPETYKINLSWSKAIEASVTGYEIFRKAETDADFSLIAKINSRNTLSYIDKSLKAGENFTYKIRAMKDKVAGEFSDIVTEAALNDTEKPVVISLEPSIKNATYAKTVTITATAQDNVAVTKLEILVSNDSGKTWTTEKTVSAATVSYKLDTRKFEDCVLKFKAAAYDAAGNVSNDYIIRSFKIDNTAPQRVDGLTVADVTTKSVLLKWNDVADDDRRAFVLQRKEANSYVTVKSDITTIGYMMTNLTPATEYEFRIAAVDACGNIGEYSQPVTVQTLPDTTAPIISDLSPSPARFSKTIPFKATAKDEFGISEISVQYSLDAVNWKEYSKQSFSSSNSTETYYCAVLLSQFPEGRICLRAVATDKYANVSRTDSTAAYIEYYVDKTAPDAPDGLTATGADGYIRLAWNQGTQADLSTYSIYRSVKADSGFQCIASDLKVKSYNDTGTKPSTVYYYKIRVCDTAGNVSGYSETVSARMGADTQKPTVSISPVDGSIAGPRAKTIGVYASDNNMLSEITVEYKVGILGSWQTLSHVTDINSAQKQLTLTLPIEAFEDGDTVYVKAVSLDASGLEAEPKTVSYSIDKAAPAIENAAFSVDANTATVSWTDGGETDVKAFMIYYSKNSAEYKHIKTTRPASSHSYNEAFDLSELGDGTYIFRIESYDNAGNSRSVQLDKYTFTAVKAAKPPVAEFSCLSEMEVTVQEYFDAAASSDADGRIISYSWDFGDGTVSDKVRPVKAYSKEGVYTVSLTVTDNDGLSSTAVKSVTVKSREQFGTIDIKVVNSKNEPVSGISVKVDGNDALHRYTDSKGKTKIVAPVGEHTVSAYLDKTYLPSIKNISVLSGTVTYVTLTVIEGSTIEGEFTITRLDLDEIKKLQEQGFDIGSEENTQYYKSTVTISYGETPVKVSANYDSSGTVINWDYTIPDAPTSGSGTSAAKPPYVPASVQVWRDTGGNEYIGVLAISAETKFLKELFDVRLDIFCNATAEFEVVDSLITLDVPDGLTVVSGYSGYENEAIACVKSIKGGTNEPTTLHWLICGDNEGEYDLSADFFGTLSPINEVVTAKFKTKEPIKVYGTSAVKTIYNIANNMVDEKFFFNLGVENVGDNNVYYPDVQFSEDTIDTFARMYNDAGKPNKFNPASVVVYQKGMILIDADGSITDIEEMPETLKPGQTVFRKYIAEGFRRYIYTEKFNDAVVNDQRDGRTLNVEAKILPTESEVFKHEIDMAYVSTESVSEVYGMLYRYDIGEKAQMEISVMWDNGFIEDYNGEASWKSSLPEYATVNSKGVVTMKKEGFTEITATLPDGIESSPQRLYVGEFTFDGSGVSIPDYNKKTLIIEVNGKDWRKVKGFKAKTLQEETDCEGDYFRTTYTNLQGSSIELTKDGYQKYIIPKEAVNSFKSENHVVIRKSIYFESDHKNSKPYISTVYARVAKSNYGNFTPGSYAEITKDTLDYIADDSVSVIVSGVGLTNPTYVISQDNTHRVTSETGEFHGTMLSEFNTERKTVVYAIDSDGTKTDAVEIKLKKQNINPSVKELMQNTTWSLFKDNKITLSKEVPLIGGSEISLDAFKLPVGIEITGNIIRVAFGFDPFDSSVQDKDGSRWFNLKKDFKTASQQIEKSKDKWTEYKKYRNQIKNNYSGEKIDPIDDKKGTFKVSCMGYAEFSIANGQLVLADESFLSLGVQLKYTYNVQGAIWVIPAYGYIEGKLDTSVSGSIKRVVPDSAAPIEVAINLSVAPELRGGVGLGVNGLLNGGVSIGATLTFENNFATKHRYMDLEGDVTLEGQAGPFKGKKKLLNGKTVILDTYYESRAARMLRLSAAYSGDEITPDEIEVSSVEVMSRDYAKNTSGWLGARAAGARAATAPTGVQMTALQKSVYEQSQAKIVSFGDKQLMTWVEDDTSRDEYNRLRLMYSVYDGVTWSIPKAVCDDGLNDMSPTLGTDGEKIFVVWQKMTRKLTAADADNLEAVGNTVELYVSEYNETEAAFENTERVSDNDGYDYLPTPVVENGECTVYWVNGSGAGNTYSIRKQQNGEESSIKEALGYVTCLVAGADGEISYSCDTDSDISTTNDISVFSINGSEATAFDNTDARSFTQLSYGIIDGKQTLFASDSNIIGYFENGQLQTAVEPSSAVSNLSSPRENCLVWTQTTEQGNELWSAEYQNGEWGNPVQISDLGELIYGISITERGDQLFGVCNIAETTYDKDYDSYETGSVSLCSFTVSQFNDLAVTLADIDESKMVPGTKTQIMAFVENKGSKTVEKAEFTVSDTLGTNVRQTVELSMKPGEEKTVMLDYPVAQNYSETEITVSCNVGQDRNPEDNTASVACGYNDISVIGEEAKYSDGIYLFTASILNNSVIDAEDVTLEVSLNDPDANPFMVQKIGTVTKNECILTEITAFEDTLVFDENGIAKLYYKVSPSNKTLQTGDDTCCVFVKKMEAIECAHTDTETVAAVEATCIKDGCTAYEICSSCGEALTQGEVIPATGHAYTDTVVEPTCTQDGYTTHVCSVCGDSYTDSAVSKTGHSYIDTVTPATCTESGYTTHVCSVCSDTYSDSEVPATGHAYTDTVVEPTCTQDGYTTHICAVCGDSYKDSVVSKTSHTYIDKVTPATCTLDGYTAHACSACGESYTDSVVKALGHTDQDNDGKCDRCGEKTGEPVNPPKPIDPSKNCSCACHKKGIAKFFFKIGLFFQKIFKKNKVCKCGASHY